MAASRINDKINLKVSSEVINTCYELLSTDMVEDFVEFLLTDKSLEQSDLSKINGAKPDTHVRMRTLLSAVHER